MGLQYDVEIRYIESGNIGAKVGKIGEKAKALESLGSSIETGMGGALSAIGAVAVGIAGLATAGIGAMATFGAAVVNINSDLEGTQIALASIFSSAGVSSSFASGMTLASQQISKMRKDAADLPGEFNDLVGIFQTISTNTFRGGMGVDETRDMAAKTMAAAAIMRIPMHVAAREMSALIEGRAGAHNIMGLRMMGLAGDKAQEFNHKSEPERIKELMGSLGKIAGPDTLEAFRHSFIGLFSTLKDNLKKFSGDAGEALFGRVKNSLERVNDWFSSHQGTVAAWAGKIGESLASAWDFAADAFERYWGPVTTFFSTLGNEIHSVWSAIAPLMSGIADSFRTSLTNGTAVENLKGLLRLYMVAKVGGPLLGAVGSNVGAMAGMGGEATMFGLVAGVAGSVTALVALAAAAGELSALMNKDSANHDAAVEAATGLSAAFSRLVDALNVSVTPALESFGIGATNLLTTVIRTFTPDSQEDKDRLEQMRFDRDLAIQGANLSPIIREQHEQYLRDHPKLNPTEGVDIDRRYEIGPGFGLHAMGLSPQDKPADKKVPNSVTHINKVEIIIQSDQDASRIARMTRDELTKLQKNTKSGFIPKWIGGKS